MGVVPEKLNSVRYSAPSVAPAGLQGEHVNIALAVKADARSVTWV